MEIFQAFEEELTTYRLTRAVHNTASSQTTHFGIPPSTTVHRAGSTVVPYRPTNSWRAIPRSMRMERVEAPSATPTLKACTMQDGQVSQQFCTAATEGPPGGGAVGRGTRETPIATTNSSRPTTNSNPPGPVPVLSFRVGLGLGAGCRI